MFLIRYNTLNNDIRELNERLEYYRQFTKQLISTDGIGTLEQQDKFKRQLVAFRYCTDSIIAQSKMILKSLKNLDNCILDNKDELENELQLLDKNYSGAIKLLVFVVVLFLVLLIIA